MCLVLYFGVATLTLLLSYNTINLCSLVTSSLRSPSPPQWRSCKGPASTAGSRPPGNHYGSVSICNTIPPYDILPSPSPSS